MAKNPLFRFYGNVCVGKDVSLEVLLREYSAVLLAYGASSDRKLQIPGDSSDRVVPARHFVNWYNGHPDFVDFGKNIDFNKIKSVVIIGQGNGNNCDSSSSLSFHLHLFICIISL